MLTYIDSANPSEIDEISNWGVVSGITTNPSIMLKANMKTSRTDLLNNVIEIAKRHFIEHISVELTSSRNVDKLIEEAIFLHDFDKAIVIKVPMFEDGLGLKVLSRLYEETIPTNATCLMNCNQVMLATLAGANYVSLFYNRIRDSAINERREQTTTFAMATVANSAELLRRLNSERRRKNYVKLICGSIRHVEDVEDCFIAGADIVTVPYKIFKELSHHPKTTEAIAEFDEAWEQFNARVK